MSLNSESPENSNSPSEIGSTLMTHNDMNETMMQTLINFMAFDLRMDITQH